MTGRERRAGDRRTGQRREPDKPASSQALVSTETPIDPAEPAERVTLVRDVTSAPAAAFAAQLIGQGGQRNGLRGGPPVLDAARSTYLGAEYSGEKERRPPTGKTGSTEV